MKKKNIALIAFFVFAFLVTVGAQKAFAASCLADESCKEVPYNAATNTFTEPTGFICESRGVCPNSPGYQVCCKASSTTTTTVNTTATTATTASTTSTGTDFTNPLEFKTVEGFLGGIMSAIQKIIVVLALVSIMIGAMMILLSAGSSKMVENGKSAITMALVGLAIGVAAPSLLKELANIVGWVPKCNPGDTGCDSLAKALTLSQIAVNVLNFLLGSMGILALVMMVIGATMYLTSAGDEHRAEQGKEIFKYSVIGIIMAMSAMILVTQVAKFFQ